MCNAFSLDKEIKKLNIKEDIQEGTSIYKNLVLSWIFSILLSILHVIYLGLNLVFYLFFYFIFLVSLQATLNDWLGELKEMGRPSQQCITASE